MPSPFSGMNPYLEAPERWPTVHNRLIVAIADVLTPQLLPRYQVDIDKRIYNVTGLDAVFIGRPDVTVQQSKNTQESPVPSPAVSSSAVGLVKKPVQVMLPMTEEVREPYLEVKDTQTQAVVTTIEILSPTNKRGEGRRKYIDKRITILDTQTNLIEIDLLTQGEPMPLSQGDVNSHYRILVSRSRNRPSADLYAFNLQEAIPSFPIPLADGDAEPIVDLKSLLDEVYEKSGYDYFIDYQQDVTLKLPSFDLKWIRDQLVQQGIRKV